MDVLPTLIQQKPQSYTQVILDKSSQKRKITPLSPPTVENVKYITRGRNGMIKEKTRRKEKNKKRKA